MSTDNLDYLRFRLAVEDDHAPPDKCDWTCDIAAALRAGYARVAAYLVQSGARAPAVEEVARSVGESFKGFGHPDADDPEWLEWREWVDRNTVDCLSCGVLNFTDRGLVEACGKCSGGLRGWSKAELDDFVREWEEAGRWHSTDEDGNLLKRSYERPLAPATAARIRSECERIHGAADDLVRRYPRPDLAFCLWLARNGDRDAFRDDSGYWREPAASRFTGIARELGRCQLVLRPDNVIEGRWARPPDDTARHLGGNTPPDQVIRPNGGSSGRRL